MSFTITSPAFDAGGHIPAEHTCDGANTLPPLILSGAPTDTISYVLVMDDPDIPQEIKDVKGILRFDHLVLYNIPADVETISGATPYPSGMTSAGKTGYVGPCPPPELEPREHRYSFRCYALPNELQFSEPPTLEIVEEKARRQALASAELFGRYARAAQ